MAPRLLLAFVSGLLVVVVSETVQADPCDADACCVNPATCVVTDEVTLAGLTVDSILS